MAAFASDGRSVCNSGAWTRVSRVADSMRFRLDMQLTAGGIVPPRRGQWGGDVGCDAAGRSALPDNHKRERVNKTRRNYFVDRENGLIPMIPGSLLTRLNE